MHDHGPSPQEKAEFFPVPYTGPKCEACDGPVTRHGDTCTACRQLDLELEAEGVWADFLAGLKHGSKYVEAFDKKLAGWKYVGGTSDSVHFLAPGHRGHLVYGHSSGSATITVLCGQIKYPDWSATFTSGTPHEIILAAAHAVIQSNG